MHEILLSDEAYQLLESLSKTPETLSCNIPAASEDALCYLVDTKLVSGTVLDYDVSEYCLKPTGFIYSVTELGKGYLCGRKAREAVVSSIREMADTAKEEAAASQKEARWASVRSWIAIIISALAVIFEIYAHFNPAIP